MSSEKHVARAELRRLEEERLRRKNWKRWGPYLSERQWGTVREDYSANGVAWTYFPHDHARSRAYRWGEDGLLGITDRECRLCFALALWNGQDPILKERLFGLSNHEGNHGEDVKEVYFYLDSSPTHSYLKAMYRYPQMEFPYARLVEENRKRGWLDPEYELIDTGVFEGNRFFDVTAEYAKASPDDILIRITVDNRGQESAVIHLLPTLWFRNTWIWGCRHEGCTLKPRITRKGSSALLTHHETLDPFVLEIGPASDDMEPEIVFTENETNTLFLFGTNSYTAYVKDAFHEYVINGVRSAVNPRNMGTKAAAHYQIVIPGGRSSSFRLRLFPAGAAPKKPLGPTFDRIFRQRIEETNAFYDTLIPRDVSDEDRSTIRQAYAGLLWNKQFYHYIVEDWLQGDPSMPSPPASRLKGRNADWPHLFNRDIVSVPDKWEYPWYAAWDLAFHMLPLSRIDPEFARQQLVMFLREWYMHPNGQIPAYEYNFSDVNPPIHAWACWRVYKIAGDARHRDRLFLARTFQKLLLNFTWWINRKDLQDRHIFSGGFLGLDNIGVFDRSQPLPGSTQLDQADATAWMAFYCGTMLSMALELAIEEPVYEDTASKFFEHFIAIADAMNSLGGTGLWHEEDGFYYDQLRIDGTAIPLRVRSLVGLIPLLAVEVLHADVIDRLPGFRRRLQWFLEHRRDLSRHISFMTSDTEGVPREHMLLAIPSRERFLRVLKRLFDEDEFLSPFGIRSLSHAHKDNPYILKVCGREHQVRYVPGESDSALFGGNSNWRGPIWFPINYLLIEALERYHHFYGDSFQLEFPTGSGRWVTLDTAANDLSRRLTNLFRTDRAARSPCDGGGRMRYTDLEGNPLMQFYEYFHGDDGRGLGASHQTGWTALVIRCIETVTHAKRTGRLEKVFRP